MPKRTLDVLVRHEVTTLCAPPTVWRMLVQEPLASYAVKLREIVGAGEPLNPEVIERVQAAWGMTIRDGYGQTETTAQIGNSPGQRLVPGSMGRPLPGYRVTLLDPDGQSGGRRRNRAAARSEPPLGLMTGYANNPKATANAMRDGFYRTSDVARARADGYFVYVGRADDVFKSSDYRLSPFELESVLIEHEAIARSGRRAEPRSRCACRCRRRSSRCATAIRSGPNSRAACSRSRANGSRRTSAFAAWNSRNCRRRSPARSAASILVEQRGHGRSWNSPGRFK